METAVRRIWHAGHYFSRFGKRFGMPKNGQHQLTKALRLLSDAKRAYDE